MMLRWFANLKIAHKLMLGFGLLILLMGMTLVADAFIGGDQTSVVDHLVFQLYPARQTAQEIVTMVYAANDARLAYVLTEDSQQTAEQLKTYDQDMQKIRVLVKEARSLANSDAQRKATDQFYAVCFGKGGFYDDTQHSVALKQAGKLEAARVEAMDDDPSIASLDAAHNYINIVEQEIAQQAAQEGQLARLTLMLSLLLNLLALCLGGGIGVLIIRSVTGPLGQVQRAAQQLCRVDVANLARGLTALAVGDLTLTAETSSVPPLYESRDEIGQTAEAMRSIIIDVQRTVHGYEVARLELQGLYGQLEEKNQALLSANTRLLSLSTTDHLTDLPNHRAVMSRIEEEISRCQRVQESAAVLFVDLDHFKHINDTWGHLAGDAILYEVGRRLRVTVRREDCVGRYGGEEFAVLLTTTDLEEARETAERIRAVLADQPYSWQPEDEQHVVSISISGSIGVAVYPEHGSTREALIEAADTAMYFAKHTGRNRVCLANEVIAVVDEVLAKAYDGQMADGVVIKTLATVVNAHDRETSAYAQRMVWLAEATARLLGRPDEELHLIRLAALLHDIGKIGVPDEILHKPGPLTEEEWVVMSRHPEISRQILVQAGGIFVLLSRIVVAHHERWDGGGYPYGLAQDAIPLGARILAVVDAYDAMISQRPYRQALSDVHARAELEKCAGSQFDPGVVAAFLQVLDHLEERAEVAQMQ